MNRRQMLKSFGIATGLSIGSSGLTSAAPDALSSTEDELFPSLTKIEEWHRVVSNHVPRYPGTKTSHRYLKWLENELYSVRGIPPNCVKRTEWTLDRWEEKQARLKIRQEGGSIQSIPLVRSVPYTQSTGGSGVRAPIEYLPPERDIHEVNVEGKIILRDVQSASIPYAAFGANSDFIYDPNLTIDFTGDYERGWIATSNLMNELKKAQAANAAGILFGLEFPKSQKDGHYRPYRGEFYDIPGLFLGVEEREQLKLMMDNGSVTAEIRLITQREVSSAYDIHATLQGSSDKRIVIHTHSDGPNVLEENGSVALLTLANYFSSLPMDSRPWTIEFYFHDAHFAADQRPPIFKEKVDTDYENGEVVLAIALEHLGVREYVAKNLDSAPGRKLEKSGLNEPAGIFSTESPALVENLIQSVIDRNLARTFMLRGVDQPGATFPPYQSYGGVGTWTHQRAIPTVAFITGPWTIFDPEFQLEAIDYDLFRRQLLAFADLLHRIEGLPPAAIAGADSVYREAKDT